MPEAHHVDNWREQLLVLINRDYIGYIVHTRTELGLGFWLSYYNTYPSTMHYGNLSLIQGHDVEIGAFVSEVKGAVGRPLVSKLSTRRGVENTDFAKSNLLADEVNINLNML